MTGRIYRKPVSLIPNEKACPTRMGRLSPDRADQVRGGYVAAKASIICFFAMSDRIKL
jgi:hypothetical protein